MSAWPSRMAYLLRNGYSNLQRVTRNICSTAIRRESNKEVVKKVQSNVKESIGIEDVRMGGRTHKVNNLEKRFLVWSGKFKTVADVPAYVSHCTL
ncbi:hypothetical protein B566_EDAN003687 [Ephemera danica]|nr:hypothetical protein B566_EDAN003687 [Ephemera danica]